MSKFTAAEKVKQRNIRKAKLQREAYMIETFLKRALHYCDIKFWLVLISLLGVLRCIKK